jgi:hypothetical protein
MWILSQQFFQEMPRTFDFGIHLQQLSFFVCHFLSGVKMIERQEFCSFVNPHSWTTRDRAKAFNSTRWKSSQINKQERIYVDGVGVVKWLVNGWDSKKCVESLSVLTGKIRKKWIIHIRVHVILTISQDACMHNQKWDTDLTFFCKENSNDALWLVGLLRLEWKWFGIEWGKRIKRKEDKCPLLYNFSFFFYWLFRNPFTTTMHKSWTMSV